MKKLYISLLSAITLAMWGLAVFATGNEEASTIISQIELTEYVIIAGSVVTVLGVVFILLAMFLKSSRIKDMAIEEEYPDDNDDINIVDDVSYQEEDVPDIIEDEPVEINENISPDEAFVPEEETSIEEVPSEEVVTVDSVKLVLSGINNPDLKMLEITDTITVGRRPSNDFVISDNAISGEHCRFIYEDGEIYVEDLNSTNGTFVNNEEIEKTPLKSGDTITFGQMQFKITIS